MIADINERDIRTKKQKLLSLLYDCEYTLDEINEISKNQFYYKNYFGHLIEKLEKDLESQYGIV